MLWNNGRKYFTNVSDNIWETFSDVFKRFIKSERIHKDESPFMNAKGVYVYWQSPYSPDFNPIELVFGWIKKKLKEYEYATELLPVIMDQPSPQLL